MNHLSKEYLILFNGISAITQDLQAVTNRLAQLQVFAENEYIENGPDEIEEENN